MALPALRTHVTFRTSRFDNCFGDDCAGWLVQGLRDGGWTDAAEPWQEDWGWQTSTARAGHKFLVSVAVRELVLALDQGLGSAQDVDEVRWHFEDEFMTGQSVGEREPLAVRG